MKVVQKTWFYFNREWCLIAWASQSGGQSYNPNSCGFFFFLLLKLLINDFLCDLMLSCFIFF